MSHSYPKHPMRGFSLIELMVVVTIIALLSAIIIGSVNLARNNAATGAIKAQFASLRTAAELMYPNGAGGYDALCASGSISEAQFKTAAENAYQDDIGGIEGLCLSSGTGCQVFDNGSSTFTACKSATVGTWAASILLKDGNYYCIDSTNAGQVQENRGIDNSPLDINCN